MPDLGLEVLLKGKNMIRILGGLWVALRISLLAVLISIPLGIVLGILMTSRNKIIKVILRIYLEIIRIMPQLVLLFLFILKRPVRLAGICRERRLPLLYLPCGERRR